MNEFNTCFIHLYHIVCSPSNTAWIMWLCTRTCLFLPFPHVQTCIPSLNPGKKDTKIFLKKGQEYKFSTCTFYRKRAYFIFSNKIYVLASEWNNTFTMKIFIVWKQQTLVSYVVYCPTPFKIWRKPVLKSNKPKIQYFDVQCGIKIFNIILLIGLYVFVEINYIFNILFMSCMPLIRWTLNSTDKIVSSKKVN